MHAVGVLEAGAEIAGVWDPDADAVVRFVAQSGGSARSDAATVLDDRPDLVIALGRGPEAATRLARLIEQDIPILADKPIGLSYADVAPLADAAHRNNRFVAVALVNRIAGVIEARLRSCCARLWPHHQRAPAPLSRLGRAVDARSATERRRRAAQSRGA
jgi:predicted dehydrogenase